MSIYQSIKSLFVFESADRKHACLERHELDKLIRHMTRDIAAQERLLDELVEEANFRTMWGTA